MSQTELVTPVTQSPRPNRYGRSAISVLLVALITSGAFAGVSKLVDQGDAQDVLLPLAIIIGSVGIVWALVLAIRAVANRESLLFPFLVLLPVFWGLSIPLLLTWPEPSRGEDDKWYFLHFFLFPLIIPLGVFALTVAAPSLLWLRRKISRAEEADRLRLRRQVRKTFLAISAAVFLVLAPFGFYLYGGTMNQGEGEPWWTVDAVGHMPRFLGDINYRILRVLPGKKCAKLADALMDRGLLSANLMADEIETRILTLDSNRAFLSLAKRSPAEALTLARKLMSALTGTKEDVVSKYFAKNVSAGELREFLKPERFSVLNRDTRVGLMFGLTARSDANDFIADAENLLDGDELTAALAAQFLADRVNDEAAQRVYLKVIDAGGRNVDRMTDALQTKRRGAVLAVGMNHVDPVKRQAALKAILRKTLSTQSVRYKEVPEYRIAFTRLLESPDEMDRVLVALILLTSADEMTPRMLQAYDLSRRNPNPVLLAPLRLHAVGDAQNRALVERARDLLRKW